MPPHTSHLLQPLGVGVFGPLKHAYSKLVEGMMVVGNNHIDKEDFLHLYPSTHTAVFTQKNICNGFAGAGLKPLNKDQVLEKITFQLRTPTPPLIEVEGSISSAFQTPQNVCQLDHKVQRLQRSLQKKRTLSSSPVSHIQHLERAAQMAMNTNLLLQQEIKVLQSENEWKTKKKARRDAALGNDTILSVQEGLDHIQQLDVQVEGQVEEQASIPCQHAPAHCRGCGIIGHTIRICHSKYLSVLSLYN